MRTSEIIALSLMLAWPLQATAQGVLRPPGDVVEDSGGHDAIMALEPEMTSEDLSDYLGVARPIVVFGDGPNDPRIQAQLQMLRRRASELKERDVVVLIDNEPAARGPLRQQLRPHSFSIVLINKDGEVALRRSEPTSARTLVRLIDRMPLRREETGSSKS